MLARYVFLAALALFAGGPVAAKERYFPPDIVDGVFERGDFPFARYSEFLAAMDEPSLSMTDIRAETYRILWLRSFHAPMVFRLTIASDGTAILVTKKTNGEGGYEPGKLVLNKETAIDGQETQELLKALKPANFWALPTLLPDVGGFDGAQWVVEGKKGREYHVVDRWGDDRVIINWSLLLMNKSGEDLQPIY